MAWPGDLREDGTVTRGRLLLAGAAGLTMTALVVYGGNGLVRVWQMKQGVEVLERELQRLRHENEQLSSTAERLREDPAETEKIAREELGYVKKGEKVLRFPPTSNQEAIR